MAPTFLKYALRFTRNNEDTARADSLARDLSDGTIDGFWDNVRKLNSSNFFKQILSTEFQVKLIYLALGRTIFVCGTNDCNTILKSSIMSKLDNVQYSNDMFISIKLIQEAVDNLECDKSAGPDGIFADLSNLLITEYMYYSLYVSVYVSHMGICL